jgi:hypothetical protein
LEIGEELAMNLRELLRYEIWSKRKTRKIFAAFGIGFAVWFLGFLVWQVVSGIWLTKGERAAAKVALQRVEIMGNSDPLSHEEWLAQSEEARVAVDAAERAARTKRDERTWEKLVGCSIGLEAAQAKVIEQKLIEQGKLHETAVAQESRQKLADKMDALGRKSCLDLHKELD